MSTTCCTIQLPGPPGDDAVPSAAGINGSNAYAALSGPFTMPAVGASGTADVTWSGWAAPGLPVFVQFLGFLEVGAVPNTTQLSLTNLGYTVNAAAGTVAPAGTLVTPCGPIGATGTLAGAAAGGALAGTYPNPTISAALLTAKGDIISHNGTAASRQAVGANNTALFADSTAGNGLAWRAVNLASADVTGVLPTTKGGTGSNYADLAAIRAAVSPLSTKGDLWVYSTTNTRLPLPTDGYMWIADSTQATGWRAQAPPTGFSLNRVKVLTTPYNVPVGIHYVGVNLTVPGATNIRLAAGATYVNQIVIVKDEKADAATNNITINSLVAENIEGAGSYVISTNRGGVRLYFSDTEWHVI